MKGFFHTIRIRPGENRLHTLVLGLPCAKDGRGVVFAEVKEGDREGLENVAQKIQKCFEAGVIKPGTQVYQAGRRGERLAILVDPT